MLNNKINNYLVIFDPELALCGLEFSNSKN